MTRHAQAKTVVLTGASDGIGAQAARNLVQAGHQVVLVGRSPSKTRAVARELGAPHHLADFADLAQVRTLADDLLAAYPRIDVLANNAGGIFGADRRTTADGHEVTFQVNYLAPFLLTELLLGRLLESRASVVNTSSVAHQRYGQLDLADLELEAGYKPTKAYGNAKLAQVLHASELVRRHGPQGLAAVSLHPGNIATGFSHDSTSPFRLIYQTPLKHLVLSTPQKGADTLTWLCTSTPGQDWQPGGYYVKRRPARTNPQAGDTVLARELYDRSLGMLQPA